MTWATDNTNSQVYYLNGLAGTGKTTISYSFCQLLEQAGLLGASYFCSRTVGETLNPRAILPTISYQLAFRSKLWASDLANALNRDGGIAGWNVRSQFERLLSTHHHQWQELGLPMRPVIVCDGFDEVDAKDEEEVSSIIELFLKYSTSMFAKVFIATRPNQRITKALKRAAPTQSLPLHEIEAHVVKADIQRYMVERLHKVDSNEWISESELNILVQRAGTLFVYASALCSYLDCTPVQKARDRLDVIISNQPKADDGSTDLPYKVLDTLYSQILDTVSVNNADVKPLLSVLVAAQSPLDPEVISKIIGIQPYRVDEAASNLYSVLTVSSHSQPIAIFHASFYDFLVDKSRSGEKFYMNISECHQFLSERCLEVMTVYLAKDNVCELESKDIQRSSIAEEIIAKFIPLALYYTFAGWISHLTELSKDQIQRLQPKLLWFFDTHILRWVECMALLGKLEDAVRLLRGLELFHCVSRGMQSDEKNTITIPRLVVNSVLLQWTQDTALPSASR